jgi:hypothetical protein
MRRDIVERELPRIGSAERQELNRAALTSNRTLREVERNIGPATAEA